MDEIKKIVKHYSQDIISWRRYFHTHPEPSHQEFNTQTTIIAALKAMGLEPKPAGGTGVSVDITGQAAGRMVAVRADIDALRLQDECGQEYQSVNAGVCHACGHDGHTAMLLGVARVLADTRAFSGTIRLLFQPSEEAFPSGALQLIAEGALAGVDAIIGAHLWQSLRVGTMGIAYGCMMASPDEFVITVHGRGGHGSMPHETVDALLTGAQIVTALNTIVSRNIDPIKAAVVSVCMFQAGHVYNVLPDTAVIKGTVRSFEQGVREHVFARMEAIVSGICQAAGASYTLDKVLGYAPVINRPDVVQYGADVGRQVLGAEQVLEIAPVMGGEDFSCYLQNIPGAFFFIGSGNPDKGITYPHHHPKFDIDEEALLYGTEILALTAIQLLAKR